MASLLEIAPIFQAAAGIGQGIGLQRQKARDDQFLQEELARRQRSRQAADQFALDAMKLQQAGRQAFTAAPTPSARLQPTALTESAKAAKALTKTSKLAGLTLTPEQDAAIKTLESAVDVTPVQFNEALDQIVQGAAGQRKLQADEQKLQTAEASKQAKFEAAQSLANEFTDEGERGVLRAIVNDPNATLAQFNAEVNRLRTQRGQAQREGQRAEEADRRAERRMAERDYTTAQREMISVGKQLRELGIDPDAGTGQRGLGGVPVKNWYDAVVPWDTTDIEGAGPGFEDPTQPDPVKQLFNRYQELKQFTQSEGTQQGQSQNLTPELARQFLQAAGGDKEKARQLARSKGYSF